MFPELLQRWSTGRANARYKTGYLLDRIYDGLVIHALFGGGPLSGCNIIAPVIFDDLQGGGYQGTVNNIFEAVIVC